MNLEVTMNYVKASTHFFQNTRTKVDTILSAL